MRAHTIVVTLGKNVGSRPMQQMPWYMFRQRVYECLVRHGGNVVQRPQMSKDTDHDQVGEWEGEKEYACTFVVLFDDYDMELDETITSELRSIGCYFHQQTIGYLAVEGKANLIYM